MQLTKPWFLNTIITVLAWGVWGALIDLPAKAGFPETLGYGVWALTMVPPALIALRLVGWKLERDAKAIFLGSVAGFLGAGGQLLLFKTLRIAPAYLVFPFIALSPLVTILMAAVISRERATPKGWVGILLALVAGVLLSCQTPEDHGNAGLMWVFLALLVLLAWGIQGFVISHANRSMRAESIFFYMMATGIMLVPLALVMTDFNAPINWGLKGPYLAALIQLLNAVGALLLVYAFRYGKAIIVSPLINAGAPVITIILSLLIAGTKPNQPNLIGILAAVVATVLMALDAETKPAPAPAPAASPDVPVR